MKRIETMKIQRTTRCHVQSKPINYHPALIDAFDGWLSGSGWEPHSLGFAGEQAIRNRHHEATIEHEANKARGNQPDIFTLSLGSVDVYYTVHPAEVVIRGYGWKIDYEPLGDFDGGGFYADASWSRPT